MALLRRITLIIMSMAAVTIGVLIPATPASAAGGVLPGCSTGGTQTSGSSKIPCPQPTAPADDVSTPLKDVVLQWQPVAGAAEYKVQVSSNGDWANNVVPLDNDGVTLGTTFELPMTLPHTTYYWRVRAQVGGDWGGYSIPRRFLRLWEQTMTILHAPSATDPTITWAPVKDASIYHVLYGSSPISLDDLSQSPNICKTTNTSFTPMQQVAPQIQLQCAPIFEGTPYYWGVAAYDDTNASPVAAPNINTPQIGCKQVPECDAFFASGGPITTQSPSTGGTGGSLAPITGLTSGWHASTLPNTPCDANSPCPTTPTFAWTPVSGANFYEVRVSRDRDQTNVSRDYTTQWPSVTPLDSYLDAQPGLPYYYSVTAGVCTSGGTVVSCTPLTPASQTCAAVSAAATSPPAVSAVSVSPAGPSGAQSMNGGAVGTVTLTATNAVAGACVVASGGSITSVPSVGSSSVTFSYNAPASGGNVTFQIINPDGGESSASPAINVVSSVTITAVSGINTFDKQSGPVALQSPADGATEHGRSFTFSWSDYLASGSQGSYEPENYELQVATDNAFTSIVLDDPLIDLTQYTDPAGVLKDGHYFWRVSGIDQSSNQLTWSAPRELTVNATGPVVSIATKSGAGILHPLRIKFSEALKGVNRRTVKVIPVGGTPADAVPGTVTLGSSPKLYIFKPSVPFATGGRYTLSLSSSLVDANGNRAEIGGAPVRISKVAGNRSRGWTYGNGWSHAAASSALSGSYASATSGRSTSIIVSGAQARLFGCKGPGMGSITVTVGGNTQTVSERQSFTRCGIEVWHRALPEGLSRLKVTVHSRVGTIDEVKVS